MEKVPSLLACYLDPVEKVSDGLVNDATWTESTFNATIYIHKK